VMRFVRCFVSRAHPKGSRIKNANIHQIGISKLKKEYPSECDREASGNRRFESFRLEYLSVLNFGTLNAVASGAGNLTTVIVSVPGDVKTEN